CSSDLPAPSVTTEPGRPAPHIEQTGSEVAQVTSHAPAPETPAPAQQTSPQASPMQQASVQPPVAPEPPPFDGPYDNADTAADYAEYLQAPADYGREDIPPKKPEAAPAPPVSAPTPMRSEEHTSELQSREKLVCR